MTAENKWLFGVLMFAASGLLYLTSNHFHYFEPKLLPMTFLDQAVPFIPQTIWLYTSEYMLFLAVFLASSDIDNLNKYLYSFFCLQVFCVTIFWIWPTTYPRELFPLPASMDRLSLAVFTSLRTTDDPSNCCPSLHVSSVYLSSFIFLDEQKKKFVPFFIWATLIAISTMTTKQHYIVDVASGLLLAIVFYVFFHKFVTYWKFPGTQPKR